MSKPSRKKKPVVVLPDQGLVVKGQYAMALDSEGRLQLVLAPMPVQPRSQLIPAIEAVLKKHCQVGKHKQCATEILDMLANDFGILTNEKL